MLGQNKIQSNLPHANPKSGTDCKTSSQHLKKPTWHDLALGTTTCTPTPGTEPTSSRTNCQQTGGRIQHKHHRARKPTCTMRTPHGCMQQSTQLLQTDQ
eukprot:13668511-Ditylum_brightwellii.AAC.1